MSTSTLPLIQNQLLYYESTTLLVLGTIGNTAIVVLFYQNRRNPCSMYLIAGAILNNICLWFNIPYILYSITVTDLSGMSMIFCKLRAYWSSV